MARWWHAAAIVVVGPALGVAVAGPPDLSRVGDRVGAGPASTSTTTTTTTPAPAETTATTAPAPPAPRAPGQVRVRVYIASTVPGAASNAYNRLRAAGYVLLDAAHAPRDQPGVTRVFFDPGFEPEARAVAALLGLPATAVGAVPAGYPLELTEEPDVMVLAGNDLAPR